MEGGGGMGGAGRGWREGRGRGCWGLEGGMERGWEGDGGEVGGGRRGGCGEGCPDSLTAAQKVVKLAGGGFRSVFHGVRETRQFPDNILEEASGVKPRTRD